MRTRALSHDVVHTERTPQAVEGENVAPKQCRGCGYIIDHLTEPRCPECGRQFDPDDPRTYWISRADTKRVIVRRLIKGAAGIALTLVPILVLSTSTSGMPDLLFELMWLWATVSLGAGFGFLSSACWAVIDESPPGTRVGGFFTAMGILMYGFAIVASIALVVAIVASIALVVAILTAAFGIVVSLFLV